MSSDTRRFLSKSAREPGRRAPHAPVMRLQRYIACLALALLFAPGATRADTFADYLDGWSDRAHEALNSEPNWNPPINTITPRLT